MYLFLTTHAMLLIRDR